jgi:3-oxoadipate enol-lactonase
MSSLLDVGTSRIACTVTGTGAPLLFLHGAEGNHHMFDALVPHLANAFTVIAYDQRDCGETQNPAAPATLADLADDAQALLRALGHPAAHVYGTSFGGRVAQALAHRHPQSVLRLVLGSTWALPEALEERNGETIRAIQSLRAKLPDSAQELAAYFLPMSFLEQQPQYKSIFMNAQPLSERSQRRFQTVADRPPLDPRDLRVPALVLAGELDRVVPPHLTLALAEAIPGAQAVLLPGLGHAAAVQAPEVIAVQLRRFCGATSTQG